MFWAPGTILKVSKVVRAGIREVWCRASFLGWSHCPLAVVSRFCSLFAFHVALLHCFRESVLWLKGSLHMCRGSSCVSLWPCVPLVVFAPCVSLFFLGCVDPLPLPKGTGTFLLQVILLFAFPLAFDRLLKFFWSFLLFFLFSCYQTCVCCQCTHQGGD
jgi:hypothetical protein